MAVIKIDFTNVPTYEVLPKGRYSVIVEKVEMKEGPSAPYLNFTLKITEGEAEGRSLFFKASLSEKAMFRLKPIMAALGEVSEHLDIQVDDETNLVTSPELVGRVAIADVIQEPYNGAVQNKVETLISMNATPTVQVIAPKTGVTISKPTATPAKAAPKLDLR